MLLVLLLTSVFAAEPQFCTITHSPARLRAGILPLIKAANETAVKNAAEFSDRAITERLSEELTENARASELEDRSARALFERAFNQRPKVSPWNLSLIPDPGAKAAVLPRTLELLPAGPSVASALAWLEKADENAAAAAATWNGNALTSFAALKSAKPAQAGAVERFGLCTLAASPSAVQCTKALGGIIGDMSVVEDPTKGSSAIITKFSMVKEMESLVTDSKYQSGLRAAAATILKRTQGGAPPKNAHLFADVEDSFRKSGMSARAAADAAWKTIAVVSTAGPALVNRLTKIKLEAGQIPGAVSLSAIAAALPALDAAGKGSGHLYSYPPGIQSNCDNGKPYHFWMAAYQARQQTLNGIPPRVAAHASFLTSVGYRLTDSEILRLLPKNHSYSPMMNVLRADFTYAAAGAAFGAASAKGGSPSISIDRGLRTAIERSIPAGKLTENTRYVDESMDRGAFQMLSDYRRLGTLVNPLAIFRDVSRPRN